MTTTMHDHDTGRLDLDEPVPYTLTPRGHAALVDDPGPAGAFPPVVCLCGSTRFVDEFNRQRKALTEHGQIVLAIEVVTTQARENDPQHVDPALKARLDWLHKRKIDLADYVLVLNVGGYVGESTRSEIAYARAAGKPVRYLEAATTCAAESIGTYRNLTRTPDQEWGDPCPRPATGTVTARCPCGHVLTWHVCAACAQILTAQAATGDPASCPACQAADPPHRCPPQISLSPEPEIPGNQWACQHCGDAYFSTPPDHGLCPDCRAAL